MKLCPRGFGITSNILDWVSFMPLKPPTSYSIFATNLRALHGIGGMTLVRAECKIESEAVERRVETAGARRHSRPLRIATGFVTVAFRREC